MNAEKYSVLETGRDEECLAFSTTPQEQACVGHPRGDFGHGTEFWTTWWEHQDDLKSQDFKDELDDLVNTLRKGGPLKDLPSMERFCREHPQARMSLESGSDYYGFRINTAQRRYYLRFLPRRGDYNFYIYCYQTDKLERAAPQADRLKVLVVEPMKPCEVREIPDSLEAMQGIVGGLIEFSAPFSDSAAIICNGDGKILDLPYNRPLCGLDGIPYDILCGTFFVAGVEGEKLVSLTDEQIEKYKNLYDNMVVLTAEKEPPQEKKLRKGRKRGVTMKDKYDLSSPESIAASAKLACKRADQEPSQDSYNAAWLHGYADALADAARQLEATRTSPKKHKRKDASHER